MGHARHDVYRTSRKRTTFKLLTTMIVAKMVGIAKLVTIAILITYIIYLKYTKVVHTNHKKTVQQTVNHTVSMRRVFQGVVGCTEAPLCYSVAKEILLKNGTAVDAAIAAMFCNGFASQQNTGMGGGFFMTVYIKQERRAYAVNAREKAPLKATRDMFKSFSQNALRGPLSTAVPGEVKGLWAAHRRWGKLSWHVLLAPSLKICREGFSMTYSMRNSLEAVPWIRNDTYLRKQYVDPSDNDFYDPGSLIKPSEALCKTLKRVAEKGGDDFYSGTLAADITVDLAEAKTIVTAEDLRKYETKITEALKFPLGNGDVLYTPPPPSSGAVLINLLNILRGYKFTKETAYTLEGMTLMYHRMIEALKYAYVTKTKLGDPDFLGNDLVKLLHNITDPKYGEEIRRRINDLRTSNDMRHYGLQYYVPEDKGTMQVSLIDNYGNAVSVTSSINYYFGAGFSLNRTGIILSGVMDDFSNPGFPNQFGITQSPANFIAPGKRPLSSLSPSILVDSRGNVKLVIGANGGPKIIDTLALIIMRRSWLDLPTTEAIEEVFLSYRIPDMITEYDSIFYPDVLKGLQARGHIVNETGSTFRYSYVCAVPT